MSRVQVLFMLHIYVLLQEFLLWYMPQVDFFCLYTNVQDHAQSLISLYQVYFQASHCYMNYWITLEIHLSHAEIYTYLKYSWCAKDSQVWFRGLCKSQKLLAIYPSQYYWYSQQCDQVHLQVYSFKHWSTEPLVFFHPSWYLWSPVWNNWPWSLD